MDDLSPSAAKTISAGIRHVPFGMRVLDNAFGGIPSGTAALLAGAPDAGADAFTYTQAANLMLARDDPELYPGKLQEGHHMLPETVVYVTISQDGDHVLHAMDAVLDQYQFDALTANLTLLDYSESFFDLLPLPGSGLPENERSEQLQTGTEPEAEVEKGTDLLSAVWTDLVAHGEDAVVIVDSLTALQRLRSLGVSEEDVFGFLFGIRELANRWNGLVWVNTDRQASQVRADERYSGLLHGALYFYSNDQGFETYRTMRIGSFGGALDREEQVVYQTLIGPAGFRVKSTKKIQPRNW